VEKTNKKIVYYIVLSAVAVAILLVFYGINRHVTPRCEAVNSYRGCLVEKNTTESKFCRTRSVSCKDGEKNCDGGKKRSCKPLYRF
jgi:hypothetical protein